jgi:hypothetical protein
MCPTGSTLQITRRDCRARWTISPLPLNAERRLPRSTVLVATATIRVVATEGQIYGRQLQQAGDYTGARIGILERDTVPCSETCFGRGTRIRPGWSPPCSAREGNVWTADAMVPALDEHRVSEASAPEIHDLPPRVHKAGHLWIDSDTALGRDVMSYTPWSISANGSQCHLA